MITELPLKFKIPKIWEHTLREQIRLPQNQQPVFHFATPYLQTWGNDGENYILQQFFTGAGVVVVLLTVCVQRNSLFRAQFENGTNIFQYTMQGYAFGKLTGHGCLHFFEDTYTLQYVPEGEHEVLFTPGAYHYMYMLPGAYLNVLSSEYPNIAQLIRSLEESRIEGKLASRQPMNHRVKELITRLQNLPGGSSETQLTVTAIVIKLVRQFYRQLKQEELSYQMKDIIAVINTFLANHIHEPVPELIKRMRMHFFMEAATLRNHWNGLGMGDEKDSPRTSFRILRLEYAFYLLIIEKLSVNEVADQLNFKNPFTFSQQFHKQFGTSPVKAHTIIDM